MNDLQLLGSQNTIFLAGSLVKLYGGKLFVSAVGGSHGQYVANQGQIVIKADGFYDEDGKIHFATKQTNGVNAGLSNDSKYLKMNLRDRPKTNYGSAVRATYENGEMEVNMAKSTETKTYCFVVRGLAPELIRGIAFRIEKHYKTRGRKILKCPYCGKDFETVDSDVKVELRCFRKKSEEPRHNIINCRICHKPVGIIFSDA